MRMRVRIRGGSFYCNTSYHLSLRTLQVTSNNDIDGQSEHNNTITVRGEKFMMQVKE